MAAPDFWNNRERAHADVNEVSRLRSLINPFHELERESDQSNAFITIHSGAGGTESCDWADMLLRMYQRWIEREGFKSQIVDVQTGEEVGIKSVTLLVGGEYAYGYLQTERGVHRLVRISPFDANKRRHTSLSTAGVVSQNAATAAI